MSCKAKGCKITRRNCERHGFKVFRFPKEKDRLAQWLKICDDGTTGASGFICSRHFTRDQFWETPRKTFIKLRQRAIPTVCCSPTRMEQLQQTQAIGVSIHQCIGQEAITEQQSQLAPPTPRASGSFDPGLQQDTELYNRAPPTPEASGSSLLYMQQDIAQGTLPGQSQIAPPTPRASGSTTPGPNLDVEDVGSSCQLSGAIGVDNNAIHGTPSNLRRGARRRLDLSTPESQRRRFGSRTILAYHTPRKLRIGNAKLKQQIKELQDQNQLPSHRLPTNMTDMAKNLFKNECRNADRPEKGRRYDESVKKLAFRIMFHSNAALDELRKHLCLPSRRSLRNYVSPVECEPGVLIDSIVQIKKDFTCGKHGLDFVLMFDEMSIRQEYCWNQQFNCYYGNTTDDISGADVERANKVLVFLVKGLAGRWENIIAYYFISSMSAQSLVDKIKDVLSALHDHDLTPHGITFDDYRFANGIPRNARKERPEVDDIDDPRMWPRGVLTNGSD